MRSRKYGKRFLWWYWGLLTKILCENNACGYQMWGFIQSRMDRRQFIDPNDIELNPPESRASLCYEYEPECESLCLRCSRRRWGMTTEVRYNARE